MVDGLRAVPIDIENINVPKIKTSRPLQIRIRFECFASYYWKIWRYNANCKLMSDIFVIKGASLIIMEMETIIIEHFFHSLKTLG